MKNVLPRAGAYNLPTSSISSINTKKSRKSKSKEPLVVNQYPPVTFDRKEMSAILEEKHHKVQKLQHTMK